MKHEEGFLNENSDRMIYYQCWLPEDNLKAVLLVVHGLAEHCGRYMNLVNRFVPLGYGVYTFDLPGHGKSYGKRVFINRFEDYIQTLAVFRDKVRTMPIRLTPKTAERRSRHSCQTPGCSHAPSYSPA